MSCMEIAEVGKAVGSYRNHYRVSDHGYVSNDAPVSPEIARRVQFPNRVAVDLLDNVHTMRNFFTNGVTAAELARRFGMSTLQVSEIVLRTGRWACVA